MRDGPWRSPPSRLALAIRPRLNAAPSAARPRAAVPEVAALEPALEALYKDLHQHPELGFQECALRRCWRTKLRALGYEVTTGVGKTGLVALLRNGPGPTVMLRTELDALPLEEKTGLPFASTATATDASGATVHVGACLWPRPAHDGLVWHRAADGATAQPLARHADARGRSPPRNSATARRRCWPTGCSRAFRSRISRSACTTSRRCLPAWSASTRAIFAPPSIPWKSSSTGAADTARIRTWRSIRSSSPRARYWDCRRWSRARPTRSRRRSSRSVRSTAARRRTSFPTRCACC